MISVPDDRQVLDEDSFDVVKVHYRSSTCATSGYTRSLPECSAQWFYLATMPGILWDKRRLLTWRAGAADRQQPADHHKNEVSHGSGVVGLTPPPLKRRDDNQCSVSKAAHMIEFVTSQSM